MIRSICWGGCEHKLVVGGDLSFTPGRELVVSVARESSSSSVQLLDDSILVEEVLHAGFVLSG